MRNSVKSIIVNLLKSAIHLISRSSYASESTDQLTQFRSLVESIYDPKVSLNSADQVDLARLRYRVGQLLKLVNNVKVSAVHYDELVTRQILKLSSKSSYDLLIELASDLDSLNTKFNEYLSCRNDGDSSHSN